MHFRANSAVIATIAVLVLIIVNTGVGRTQVASPPAGAPVSPATQTFVLSAPVVRNVTAAPSSNTGPRSFEPDVFVNVKSLEDQKLLAGQNKLGRSKSGTLLFASPSPRPPAPRAPAAPQPQAEEKLKLVTNTTTLNTDTGAKTKPQPAIQTMGHQRNVAVDMTFAGDSENLVPPDAQLAVGLTQVLEMDNGNVTVWNKTSALPHRAVATFPLQAGLGAIGGLMPAPALHSVGDPWVIYDIASHRWIATAMVFQKGVDSSIQLAISPPDNPLGGWTIRTLVPSTGALHDQPKIALTDDKLIIAWTDFDSEGTYLGGSWAAFSKAAVLNSSDELIGQGVTKPDLCEPNPIPAKNQSAGTTGYILSTVYPDADPQCFGAAIPLPTEHTGNDIKVTVVDGLPPALKFQSVDLKTAEYSAPPDVFQLDSETPLSGGDTRLLSAVWQNGKLWAAANGSCKVSGADSARGCFRLFEIATYGTVRMLQDINVAIKDRDILYPSLSVDGSGNVFAAVAQVSASRYLGAAVFARVAFHSDWQLLTYAQGSGKLECGDSPTRIGDYSGADHDPVAQNSIWLAVEVPSGPGCHQGSSISKVSIH